ncbi:MAG: GTPase ObgE, partial [Flavobacteriales bacterium]
IIEGAADGKGLGHRFLRHIERNSSLLFMIACDSNDIRKEFDILLNELKRYNPDLLDKKRLLAITKSDMLDAQMMEEMKAHIPADIDYLFISSVTGYNIDNLKDRVWSQINNQY